MIVKEICESKRKKLIPSRQTYLICETVLHTETTRALIARCCTDKFCLKGSTSCASPFSASLHFLLALFFLTCLSPVTFENYHGFLTSFTYTFGDIPANAICRSECKLLCISFGLSKYCFAGSLQRI